MADTPAQGETANQPALENNNGQPTTPPVVEKKTDDGEVERLRKEAEQATMRANQLANQLKAKEDAEAAAKAKKLQEKEEYKTLYEQEKAKREEAEREREAEEQRKAVTEAAQNILSDYSDDVKDTAKDLGLSLSEVTDEAVAEFKGKLDKIQTRIGNQRVTSNNPGGQSGKKQHSREELYEILNDPARRDEYYRQQNGVTASMMNAQQ
jgi:hypothetical protein